ncbi:MAG: tRNA (adenosine(37)-N6)-threonylcarbamoyltransferase complex dimerization subunit type 1 TsaB [Phycisphaeraceae bacterium]|nr:tRNA (adenosine(37)-N6)-threonylcarbamoyltransferase complex dimerization subunit type 1 TsaB [Phycisphaeraceae bacterium]
MSEREYSLAIETSARQGSVSLGRGDVLLGSLGLTQARRHNVELMPAVDAILREHGARASDLGEVYVSIGPGSFTGLRVGLAAAQMMRVTLGVKLAAVPSVEVVAQNAPGSSERPLLVCLNLKRATVYGGWFGWDGKEGWWKPAGEARLATLAEHLAEREGEVMLLGDPLAGAGGEVLEERVRVLSAAMAQPRSEAVWRLGRRRAMGGAFVEADELLPLYVRPPEAQELWDRRHGGMPKDTQA